MTDVATNTEATGAAVQEAALDRLFDDVTGFLPRGKITRRQQPAAPRKRESAPKQEIVLGAGLQALANLVDDSEDVDEEVDDDAVPPKPVTLGAWYKVGLVKGTVFRLSSKHFGEDVLLPKVLGEVAMESLAELSMSDNVKVQLTEKDGNPRLKVVALKVGEKSWTLKEAQVEVKARPRPSSPDAVKTQQVSQTKQTAGLVGTLKWFDATKGFGFIVPNVDGEDVFLHISAVECAGLEDKLPDKQRLFYDLVRGKDGRLMAGNLKLA